MEKNAISERIRTVAGAVTGELEIELVHLEMAGTKRDSVVRIFIDKEGGVTLEDCSRVSRGIEEILDAEDLIPSRYVLEVSSPGIERQLYSLSDFVKFTGDTAKVKTRIDLAGQKTFVGVISSVEGSEITIDDRTKGSVKFDYADVEKANLKIDLSKEFGRR